MRLAGALYLQGKHAPNGLYIRIVVSYLAQGAEIASKRKPSECYMLARSPDRCAGLLILDPHLANLAKLGHDFEVRTVDEAPSAL